MIFAAIIFSFLILQTRAEIGEFQDDNFKKPIVDVLNQTYYGQCLVPTICLDRGQSCGIDLDHHVTVNCSNRMAGPYVPFFQTYILPRRTWDFDFSNNYIEQLQSLSFIAPVNISVNLTRLDLSHNYIFSIAPATFKGEVSKMLHTLDLSHNLLKDIEMGVFDDMPALRTLDLSHNELINLDSPCQAPFASLTSLNAEYNRLARITKSCLSSSAKSVDLQLGNNYITSLDDCSYSEKADAKFEPNPIICGCSTKFSGSECLQIDSRTNTSVIESQPSCDSTPCEVISYDKSYQWVDSKEGTYTVMIKIAGDVEYTVDIIQYVEADEILSPRFVQSKRQVTGEMTSGTLTFSNKYSVCVSRTSDTKLGQRSCEFLTPPRYYSSDARQLSASVVLLFVAMLPVFC